MPEQKTLDLEVGRLLATVRKERGWTQEQAARKLGVARTTLGNIETGRYMGDKFLDHLDHVYPEISETVHQLLANRNLAGDSSTASDPGSVHIQGAEISEVFRRKRAVRPSLAGNWYAIWQTSVDEEEVINTEEILIKWRGDVLLVNNLRPSPENPKGGYKWVAKMELFDNAYLLGRYIATDPDVLSKGTLFLTIHKSGRLMFGRWVGCNYDSDVATGATLFSRAQDRLHEEFRRYCDRTNLSRHASVSPRDRTR